MSSLKRFWFKGLTHKSKIPDKSRGFINKHMGFDSFLTLFNYMGSGLTARYSTAGTILDLYKRIESGEWEKHWDRKYGEKEKTIVLEMLQLDLLSKAMMSIEDLSTFSSCFPNNVKNLHKRVFKKSSCKFIQNVESNRHLDFAVIFGFPAAKTLKLGNEEMRVYKNLSDTFHNLVKAKFLALEKFRETYYQAYISFKHSYAGLMPNCQITESNIPGTSVLEETIWVGEKGKPFSFDYGGYIIRSYDNADKYLTVIAVVNFLMEFLVQNWLEKVWYLDVNALPVEVYKTDEISEDELLIIKKIWRDRKGESKMIKFNIDIGKWSSEAGPKIFNYDFSETFNDILKSL